MLSANAESEYFADFGDIDNISMPPVGKFAILSSTDSRLDPAKYAGEINNPKVSFTAEEPFEHGKRYALGFRPPE